MTTRTDTTTENIIEVSAERLEMGTWCHARNRLLDEGDIAASYSADVIGLEGRVRRPFQFKGSLFATVGMRHGSEHSAEAYRLQLPELFAEPIITYTERCRSNDARNSPNGFYHGILVRHGNKDYVLVGPPQRFVASNEQVLQQGSLF